MAAGIPACVLSVRVKPAPLFFREKRRLVACGFMQAGVEIIPLEPDQRSDLRREAPSVTLTFPPLFPALGMGADSGIADVLFFFSALATARLQTGEQTVCCQLITILNSCPATSLCIALGTC